MITDIIATLGFVCPFDLNSYRLALAEDQGNYIWNIWLIFDTSSIIRDTVHRWYYEYHTQQCPAIWGWMNSVMYTCRVTLSYNTKLFDVICFREIEYKYRINSLTSYCITVLQNIAFVQEVVNSTAQTGLALFGGDWYHPQAFIPDCDRINNYACTSVWLCNIYFIQSGTLAHPTCKQWCT